MFGNKPTTRSTLRLGAFLTIFLSFLSHQVSACSCFPESTLQSSFEASSSNTVVLKVRVRKEIKDDDLFNLRTFKAKTKTVYKADDLVDSVQDDYCNIMESKLENKQLYIRTGPNEAECGVDLKEGRTYLLIGTLTFEKISKRKTVPVLDVSFCTFQSKYSHLTKTEKKYLNAQRNCRCGTNACGALQAPGDKDELFCPDNATPAGPPSSCTYDAAADTCVFGDLLDCPTCRSDADCVEGETFCSDGDCRAMGACSNNNVLDCWNPSNEYFTQDCIGFTTCDSGVCGLDCTNSCECPPEDTSSCGGDDEEPCECGTKFACEGDQDPCLTTRCNVEGSYCVASQCGGCNAIWLAPNGVQVCNEEE